MVTESQVLDSLTAMRLSGLKDFGRWPVDGPTLSAMVKVWHGRFVAHAMTSQELSKLTVRFIDRGGEFPSVSDFLKKLDREELAPALMVEERVPSLDQKLTKFDDMPADFKAKIEGCRKRLQKLFGEADPISAFDVERRKRMLRRQIQESHESNTNGPGIYD